MTNAFPLDKPTDETEFDSAIRTLFDAAIEHDITLDGKRWVIRTDESTNDWELEIHPVV
ncbi:MAG: hypothetical protein ABEJ48_06510 [Halobacteriales archaeon]